MRCRLPIRPHRTGGQPPAKPVPWTWVAASQRGTSHERSGVRLQDAFVVCTASHRPDVLLAVVSDGAGSARRGGEGASLLCRTVSVLFRKHFKTSSELPTEADLQSWLDAARDRLAAVAERRDLQMRDFACTMVAVISTAHRSVFAHVGDGCAVIQDAQSGSWRAASWPDQGEYASTTYFVTDDAGARLRVSFFETPISAVAVFTDGIERLVLEMAAKRPAAAFFDRVVAPVRAASEHGRCSQLSDALRAYLQSDAVTSRTDDDKTLVIAIPR
jgi:hypothetical protein